MTALVLVDQPAPGVRVLSLNRPEQLNAMTAELSEALHAELRPWRADRELSRRGADRCRAGVLRRA